VPLCQHQANQTVRQVAGLATSAGSKCSVGSRHVYGIALKKPQTLRTLTGTFALAACKYYSTVRCLIGNISEIGPSTFFTLETPFREQKLLGILADMAGEQPLKNVYITKFPLIWAGRLRAKVDLISKPERVQLKFKKATAVKKARTDDAEDVEVIEIDENEFNLEQALEELFNADLMEAMPEVAEGEMLEEDEDEEQGGEEEERHSAEDGQAEMVASEPRPEISEDERAAMIAKMDSLVKANRDLILEAHTQRKAPVHSGRIRDKVISLVKLRRHCEEGWEDSIELVRWEIVSQHRARTIYLDDQDRVKYFVPGPIVEVNREALANAEVLIATCPLEVWKLTRYECPKWIVLLAKQGRARIYAGPLDNQQYKFGGCVVCDAGGQHPKQPAPDAAVFVCSECTSAMHMDCSLWIYECLGRTAPIFTEQWVCPCCYRDVFVAN